MSDVFDPVPSGPTGPRASGFARGLRRTLGFTDVVLAVGIVVSLSVNIVDRQLQGQWDPTHFFHFFTIETSILNVVALLAGGAFGLLRDVDPRWYTLVRAMIVSYGIVVGVVYNLLLAHIPADDGYINTYPWTNTLEHMWAPIYLGVEWLLRPGRARLGWNAMWICAIYPIVWAIVAMLRGLGGDGWFPYFFLNPGETGVGGVILYIAAIAALMLGLCAIAVSVQRLHARVFVDAGVDRARL